MNISYKTKLKNLWLRIVRSRQLYLMVLPGILAVLIFHYFPLYGVQIAFKNFRPSLGIWGSEWVGFKHFIKFFKYPYFWDIIKNTIWISVCSLLLFPCSAIFALMLNEVQNSKIKKICQQITYAPYFVSVVVLCAMLTLFSNRAGLFNIITGLFGAEAVDFLAKPEAFAPLYAISGLWTELGYGTIIYLAALSGVSMELVEAAKLDGASRIGIIRHVYIPHIKPTFITLLILRMGTLLSVGFEKTFLLQNPLNKEASNIIATYVYEVGLLDMNYSYSTAIGLFNCVINIAIIVLANYLSKKFAKTGLW